MRQLIRFEDKYGMPDIVCQAQDLGLPNLSDEKITCETNNDDTFIQIGWSIGAVLAYDSILHSTVIDKNIEEIIYVYDMDALSGKGILAVAELQAKVNMIKDGIRTNNSSVSVRFAPIVWSAETVALYNFLDLYENDTGVKCVDITKLVHSKNTAKLHGRLLEELLLYNNVTYSKIKHVRSYINDKVYTLEKMRNIIKHYPKSINKEVLKWITGGDSSNLFDTTSVIQQQQKIVQLYKNNLPSTNEKIICYGKEINLDKKCW